MKKKGIYLQGLDNEMSDKSVLVKHSIAQISEPNENGFCDEPIVYHLYLKPDVLTKFTPGQLVSFEIDVKIKKDSNGKQFAVPVPVNVTAIDYKTFASIGKAISDTKTDTVAK